ncbi:FAS1-like dehydratase domain-containing protein [Enemella sp. A6]|uniref:FAS1-like dehydratase domain-containing protein n=1 Tax=Enemella sp. A6 TaxID=3440152 RepID=UPI003EC03CCC
MPITAEHVGRSYPPTPAYPVGQAKIEEFATALGERDSAYHGPDAVAPPTFAFVISSAAWQALFDDAELGLALHRILHADQKFSFVRPIRVGDEITATLTITSVRNRGGADMIGTEVLLRDHAGEAVATVNATLLHSGEENA